MRPLFRSDDQPDGNICECREKTRLSLGIRDVMGTVYDQLGLSSLLGEPRKIANRKSQIASCGNWPWPTCRNRRVSARRKRRLLANQAGIMLNLDSVYRSMDYLDAAIIDKECRMFHEAAEKLLKDPSRLQRRLMRLHSRYLTTGTKHC